MENIPGGVEKHLKENSVIGHRQQSLTRAESCLSNLISYYDRVTHIVGQEKPVDLMFLEFDGSDIHGPI